MIHTIPSAWLLILFALKVEGGRYRKRFDNWFRLLLRRRLRINFVRSVIQGRLGQPQRHSLRFIHWPPELRVRCPWFAIIFRNSANYIGLNRQTVHFLLVYLQSARQKHRLVIATIRDSEPSWGLIVRTKQVEAFVWVWLCVIFGAHRACKSLHNRIFSGFNERIRELHAIVADFICIIIWEGL